MLYWWLEATDGTGAEVVLFNYRKSFDLIDQCILVQMQLNAAECKELVIDFKKCKHSFEPLFVSDMNLTVVQNAKILGLTVANNLTWNTHIGEIITKANKCMYFLALLRKTGVPFSDIVNFYCTCVRPLLEHCAPYLAISARISREF